MDTKAFNKLKKHEEPARKYVCNLLLEHHQLRVVPSGVEDLNPKLVTAMADDKQLRHEHDLARGTGDLHIWDPNTGPIFLEVKTRTIRSTNHAIEASALRRYLNWYALPSSTPTAIV